MLITLSAWHTFAQHQIEDLSISYGAEIEDNKAKIIKIIGEADNQVYALALRGKDEYSIRIFTAEGMKFVDSKIINFPDLKDKEVSFEEITMLDGKIYALGSMYYRKDKTFSLVSMQIDKNGNALDKGKVLFQAKAEKSSQRGGFYFKTSGFSDEILIMHTALYGKEDAFRYEIKLFDANMNESFSDVNMVSYDDSKKDYEFSVSDFEVDGNGDVFVVTNESYRDKKAKEKVENFKVYAYKAANAYKKEVVDVNFKGKEVINCSLFATGKNTLKVVGFYSTVRDSGRANKDLKGIYETTIDIETLTYKPVSFNDFDLETKKKILGERRANRGKELKPTYIIHSVLEKEDGGLIILSEYRSIISSKSGGAIGGLGLGAQSITYITNEIIVTSLDANGALQWTNIVAKDQDASVTVLTLDIFAGGSSGNYSVGAALSIPLAQMGKGPEYLSAIPMYKDGQLYVLFNDNKKNMGVTDIDEIKNLGNYNKAVPTLFIFDQNGNLSRKDPKEVLDDELVLRPGVFLRKSDSDYIIYASRKRQDKLGRLKLK